MYRRYFAIVQGKCSRMLRNPEDAADVAQETFMRLWAQRKSIRNPEAITSWIYRTSTRLAVERYQRQLRLHLSGTTDDDAVGHAAAAMEISDPERTLHVRQVLAYLRKSTPQRELEATVLHRIDGLTYARVAEVMGTSERTVRRLLSKFQQRIGKLQAAEGNA